MRSASRRFMTKARVAVPLAAVAVAVAGCGASAPSAAPPSGATAATTTTSPATPSTSTGVPTVSAAPTTSSADAGAVCTTDDTILTPSKASASTPVKPYGQGGNVSVFGSTVTVQVGKPQMKKPASGDIFAPSDGQVYLIFPVSASFVSGDSTSVYAIQFTLRDAAGNVCDYQSLSDAVPSQQQLDSVTLSASSKTGGGSVVFAVPPGQDYSKYTVTFSANDNATANLAWRG